MRAAVYATPAPGSELARLAGLWLGRDAFTGAKTRPADPVRDPIVAEAARYGFHATMRAPFRLQDGSGLDTLSDRLAAFCDGRPASVIRKLTLDRLDWGNSSRSSPASGSPPSMRSKPRCFMPSSLSALR